LKWPNFFIVGAQNSATTALYTYLRTLDGVFMPAMKEPHYFSSLSPTRRMRYPISHVGDREAYLRLFAKAGDQIAIGEASSSYLWEPRSAARIHEVSPQARIIIMLRDPIARAYSHYLMDLREGWAALPFYDALLSDWDSRDKGYGISRLYVELGLYRDQVSTYLTIFGRRAVRIILFDEFIGAVSRGDAQLLQEIESFLGLDTDQSRSNGRQIAPLAGNGYAQARFDWARRFAGKGVVRRLGQAVVPPRLGSTFFIKQRLYEPLFLTAAEKPPIEPRARRWLSDIYDKDVARLESLLGMKLPELRKTW
jgi:hypothetical protein